MKKAILAITTTCLMVASLSIDSSSAFAGTDTGLKVIVVHGFSGDKRDIHDTPADHRIGDAVNAGYDSYRDPFRIEPGTGLIQVLDLLNKYCRKDQGQSCRLVGTSMGGLVTAATIDRYNESGMYDIVYSTQLISAEGGTEVASLGEVGYALLETFFGWLKPLTEFVYSATGKDAVVGALSVAAARSRIDHNNTNGVSFYNAVGNKSFFPVNVIVPGKDDGLIGFHSTCSYRQQGAYDRCMGQKKKKCFLWWCKTDYRAVHENRQMHPLTTIWGEPTGHTTDLVKFGSPIQ